MALAPVKRRIGDDWLFRIGPFTSTDPTTGNQVPLDLTGFTFGGNLWPSYGAAAIPLAGTLASGIVSYLVPRSTTADLTPDACGSTGPFPTVVELFWIDANALRRVFLVQPVNVLSERDPS